MRRGGGLIDDFDAGLVDEEAALGKELNGLGVGDTFLLKDAGGEGVGGVIFEDGAGALEDDGAGIVLVGDEVDGAAGDFAAALEDGLVDVMAP